MWLDKDCVVTVDDTVFDKDETDEERRARGVKGTKAADFTEFESNSVTEGKRGRGGV